MILDSLRYWVTEMHVDGFRFDLASILSRDEDGQPAAEPAGALGHRVGSGAGRDEADRRGVGRRRASTRSAASSATPGRSGTAASATTSGASSRATTARSRRSRPGSLGSPDIYGHKEREAEQSINFVTCHDGFTLNDLVSYNDKHNEANGEDNRDGAERQPELELRRRGADRRPGDRGAAQPPGEEPPRDRLLLSAGTPMLLDGRRGAPHAAAATTTPTARTTRSAGSTGRLRRAARRRPSLRPAPHRVPPAPRPRRASRDDAQPDPAARSRAGSSGSGVDARPSRLERPLALAGVHAAQPARRFPAARDLQRLLGAAALRAAAARRRAIDVWRRCIDTALASPDDICHVGDAPEVTGARYVAQPRSVVVLAMGLGAIDRHDGPGSRTRGHEPDRRQ